MSRKIGIVICVVALLLSSIITVIALSGANTVSFLHFFSENKELQKNDTVIATVNGAPIYEHEMKTQFNFAELSYHTSVEQVESMNIDEETRRTLLTQLDQNRKTEQDVLNDLIEKKVLLQEAQKYGVSVSEVTARKFAEEQYSLAKQLAESPSATDQKNYEFIQLYMQENNLTEEYIESTVNAYRNILVINSFYEEISKMQPDAVDENGFTEAYRKSLLDKAKIVCEK